MKISARAIRQIFFAGGIHTPGTRGFNFMKRLYLGCTSSTAKRLGVHAIINARNGEQWRNYEDQQETERKRDARKIQDRLKSRVRFYQFNSKFFRRHQARLQHLISSHYDI